MTSTPPPPSGFQAKPFTDWDPLAGPVPRAKDESLYHVHNYIAMLDHVGKAVERVDGNPPVYEPHRATYLKLALVTAYARTFLPIARRNAPKVRYLDILSASGLSRPNGEKHPVPGSAIFVPLCWKDFKVVGEPASAEFDECWAFDKADDNLAALGRRIGGLRGPQGYNVPKTNFVRGDVNATVPNVARNLAASDSKEFGTGKKAPLYLAFIDNEGLDVHMDTVQAIQQNIRADLMFHVNCRGIFRLVRQQEVLANEGEALTKFFGNDKWKGIKTEEDVGNLYHKSVESVTGQGLLVHPPVHIRGRQYNFTMVFCARKTGGVEDGPGWLARIQKFIEACNRLDVDDVDYILNRVVKGQSGLAKFF
jgi:three-Cys-motif partner protein